MEERLNRIELKQDAEIKENAVFRGELRSFMQSTEKHINSVSSKADRIETKMDAHMGDLGAHGAKAKNELTTQTMAFLGMFATIAGTIGAGVHWALKHLGGAKG